MFNKKLKKWGDSLEAKMEEDALYRGEKQPTQRNKAGIEIKEYPVGYKVKFQRSRRLQVNG